jgi:hypothetical protein
MTVPGPTRVKSWPSLALDMRSSFAFLLLFFCGGAASVRRRRDFPNYLHYAINPDKRQRD